MSKWNEQATQVRILRGKVPVKLDTSELTSSSAVDGTRNSRTGIWLFAIYEVQHLRHRDADDLRWCFACSLLLQYHGADVLDYADFPLPYRPRKVRTSSLHSSVA